MDTHPAAIIVTKGHCYSLRNKILQGVSVHLWIYVFVNTHAYTPTVHSLLSN